MNISRLRVYALLICIISPHVYATTDKVAIPRIMELIATPTQASITEIIALGSEGSTNTLRQQFVFTALVQIGPSNSGDQYAKNILDSGKASVTELRGALGYLAEHAASWMSPYAETYLGVTNEGAVRCMAAYLAGQLKLTAQKETVISILKDPSYGDWRLDAAMGLAHLANENDFQAVMSAVNMREWDKTLVKSYNGFIWADLQKKEQSVKAFLRRSEAFLKLSAMRYLLENNKLDLLKQLYVVVGDDSSVSVPNAGYQALIRMLGYQIGGNINAIEIIKLPLI